MTTFNQKLKPKNKRKIKKYYGFWAVETRKTQAIGTDTVRDWEICHAYYDFETANVNLLRMDLNEFLEARLSRCRIEEVYSVNPKKISLTNIKIPVENG